MYYPVSGSQFNYPLPSPPPPLPLPSLLPLPSPPLPSPPSFQVMAPLTGYFQLLDPSTLPTPLSYDPTNSLILTPTESSFNGIYFIIANLRPEPSVVSSEPRLLLSGDVIGYPDDSVLVAEESFIHVEAYRVVDGNEYAIDPTQFLQPNLDPQVGIQFECNDLVTYVGGMVVDRWAIAPTELETVLIGDPLVNGVPDHEFPQPHDLILSAEGSMTSSESVPFFQSSTFIMVGPIPVQFGEPRCSRIATLYHL